MSKQVWRNWQNETAVKVKHAISKDALQKDGTKKG